MEYVALIVILVFAFIVVVAVVSTLVSIRLKRNGISKDYAEQIAMRKFGQGQIIGTRFAKEGRIWIWEFDVLDRNQIQRVSVDARRAVVTRVRVLPAKPYPTSDTRMFGKRAGPAHER